MKKKYREKKRGLRIFTVLLSAVLVLGLLAGCNTGKEESAKTVEKDAASEIVNEETIPAAEDSEIEDKTQQDTEEIQQDIEDVQHDTAAPEGYTVTVSSTEELLDAIAPGVGILIEPGYYNMSEYLEEVWAQEGESWNERHPYVKLQDCYDGVEVVIRRVNNMSLYGNNEELTEIVIDPRYGQVFNFEECYDISLFGLTMGHTEVGECSGNVLDFYGCRDITLSAMDLYGCGVYGIGCYDGTGEMYVYSSTIRDCSYGALEIFDGNGRFEFHNCCLIGSEGYDHYEKSPYSELAFYECLFGDSETSYYMFREDVYTEDCVWSENYIYPDHSEND